MFIPPALSRMFYRWDDIARRRGVWRIYRLYRDAEIWSADRIEAFQVAKLRDLLRAAREGSPYYARVLRERDVDPARFELSDLSRLPLLTRQIVRAHGEDIRARGLAAGELIPNNTSGSTGSVTHFWVDRECWRWRDAASLQIWERMGLPALSSTVNVWGTPIDERWIVGARNRVRQFLDNKRVLSAFRLGDDAAERCVRYVARVRPRVLTGYASVIDSLATFVRVTGFPWDPPDGFTVVTQAETLYAEQRENIAGALGARVLSLYGSRELGVIAAQCGRGEAMHVFAQRHLIERLPAEDGLGHRLVVTDLQNRGFPFLRYEIGDLAPTGEATCSCGSRHPMLKGILGRSLAIIRSPEGKAVAGNFFSFMVRECVRGVEDWQAYQVRRDTVEIRVAPRGILDEGARAKLAAEVLRALGPSMNLIVTEHDRLEALASGKRNFVSIAPELREGATP